jgi:hypothetical protein
MRVWFLLLCVLSGAGLLPAQARADDAPPEAPQQAAPGGRALPPAERTLAGEIGRGLLAPEASQRAQAVARLVTRLAEGRDTERFLRAMAEAIESWANQRERLLEVWIDQAVHGTAAEREQAVVLLSALGPTAVRRLTTELRHQHLHRGLAAGSPRAREDAGPAAAVGSDEAPPATGEDGWGNDEPLNDEVAGDDAGREELAAGVPRRYELGDLIDDGWSGFKLSSMLRREADAVSVFRHDRGYIVNAAPEGHDRLRQFLVVLRSGQTRSAAGLVAEGTQPVLPSAPAPGGGVQDNRKAAKGPGVDAPAGDGSQEDGGPSAGQESSARSQAAPPTSQQALPIEGSAAQPGPPPVPLNRVQPAWRVVPMILHLPRGKALAAQLTAEHGTNAKRGTLLAAGEALTGSLADVKHWAALARRMPDARADLNLLGNKDLPAGERAQLFSGKVIRYSKDVSRLKGGAWGIVEGTIRNGIELEIAVARHARGLHVTVIAQRTDVGTPLPVVTVRPSPGAVPVELEQPEWSTTRLRMAFDLPGEAGGAFLPLEGLGRSPEDQVVLVLAVLPYAHGSAAGQRAESMFDAPGK